jgi:hypothetical protein
VGRRGIGGLGTGAAEGSPRRLGSGDVDASRGRRGAEPGTYSSSRDSAETVQGKAVRYLIRQPDSVQPTEGVESIDDRLTVVMAARLDAHRRLAVLVCRNAVHADEPSLVVAMERSSVPKLMVSEFVPVLHACQLAWAGRLPAFEEFEINVGGSTWHGEASLDIDHQASIRLPPERDLVAVARRQQGDGVPFELVDQVGEIVDQVVGRCQGHPRASLRGGRAEADPAAYAKAGRRIEEERLARLLAVPEPEPGDGRAVP